MQSLRNNKIPTKNAVLLNLIFCKVILKLGKQVFVCKSLSTKRSIVTDSLI